MRTTIVAALAAIAVAAAAVPADAQAPSASPRAQQSAKRAPATDNDRRARMLICRGAAVPDGWILVDDVRDKSQCEGNNPAVLRLYNVWVVERYDMRPSGTVIAVCASTPTPPGWTVVDVYRDRDTCGHPTDPFAVNVKTIRKR